MLKLSTRVRKMPSLHFFNDNISKEQLADLLDDKSSCPMIIM